MPAALQLARAVDLPAGSCAFEENTCSFDSVLAFRPWILNEEGKEARCPGVPKVNCPAGWLFHVGNAILGLNPLGRKSVRHGSSFQTSAVLPRWPRKRLGVERVFFVYLA